MFCRDTFAIARHNDDVDTALHEIGDEITDQLVATACKTSFQDNIAAFDVSELAQLLEERSKDNGVAHIGSDGNEANTRDWGSRLCTG